MYQHDDLDDVGLANPMTGTASCPDGYQIDKAARALKSDSIQRISIWVHQTQHQLSFGGAYQVSTNDQATFPNSLTGADSCPPGYGAYKYGRVVAPEPQGRRFGADLYICFNNIVATQ
jgi:hypothetical protein